MLDKQLLQDATYAPSLLLLRRPLLSCHDTPLACLKGHSLVYYPTCCHYIPLAYLKGCSLVYYRQQAPGCLPIDLSKHVLIAGTSSCLLVSKTSCNNSSQTWGAVIGAKNVFCCLMVFLAVMQMDRH